MHLALRYVERPEDARRGAGAGVLGAVAVLSSHAAVLCGAVLGVLLVGWWWRARPRPRPMPLAVLGTAWSVSAVIAAWASVRLSTPDTREYMRAFWADGFAPVGDGLTALLVWIPEGLFHLLAHLLTMVDDVFWPLAVVPAALAAPGVVPLVRRHGWRAAIVLAPAAAALIGSFAQILPMRHRVALYAGWPLLLAANAPEGPQSDGV